MKILVISSLEPEHLSYCLLALKKWVDAKDIFVLNNASERWKIKVINHICLMFQVNKLRLHELKSGESTKCFMNKAIKYICSKYLNEIIFKIDEDVIIVSTRKKFEFGRGLFLIPNITINNFTIRSYIQEIWPDLITHFKDHPKPWHYNHPRTNINTARLLFKKLYMSDPIELIKFCERTKTIEYIGANDWENKNLHDRGVSNTAIAFHAQDYLTYITTDEFTPEVLMANAVRYSNLRYKIDYSIFCHHINYYTIRDLVKKHAKLINTFNEKILTYYAMKNGGVNEVTEDKRILSEINLSTKIQNTLLCLKERRLPEFLKNYIISVK